MLESFKKSISRLLPRSGGSRAEPTELPEELALRREVAAMQLLQAQAVHKEMLSIYGAADKGRANYDWKASPASADAAIINDAATLNARARQIVRDSWIGRSAVRAFSRNVIGCGIVPVPMVRDKKGNFLAKVNDRILKLFWAWANDKNACDVEKRQSFWQKQNLLVEERVTVGEGFLVWSYKKPMKRTDAVGLRLQSFEAEQLDMRLLSWTDPASGVSRQVRGGVEVDEFGAATAYHFYTRNPSDYLPVSFNSVRIPADRVFHYFKQERVLQVRGVTQLAPVLQDIRDFNRFRQATLWRAIMEACIGAVVKKTTTGPGSPLNFGAQPGAATTTNNNKRLINFTPGMVADLGPGEELDPFMPTTPGNQYAPFTDTTINGVGAGIGLSGSQISRKSDSNYSAARQDMLEDRKEFEPEQEMCAHNVLFPIYRLFVQLAAMEGKLDEVLDVGDFADDPTRFYEVEYVAPAAPWIDPEKEANAYEKLIRLKVMDREEVAHLRGRRLDDIWSKIAAEQDDAKAKGIALPEEDENAAVAFKRDVVKAFIADGTVSDVMANKTDLGKLVSEAGLPEYKAYQEPLLPIVAQAGPLVSGDVITDEEGDPVGGDVLESSGGKDKVDDAGDAVPDGTPNDAAPANDKSPETHADVVPPARKRGKRVRLAIATRPPKYRNAEQGEQSAMCCGTCSYLLGDVCQKFNVKVDAGHVCDAWEAKPVSAKDSSPTKKMGPYTPDGEKPLDLQFFPDAEKRDVGTIGPN